MRAGSLGDLKANGYLTAKAGPQPVCVFWHEGRAYALDDRCPHMGFPLHRGTVENGLVTCHWHHARFDLASGGTMDPFADDAGCYPVEVEGDDVVVLVEPAPDRTAHHRRRLQEGLEHGLTLVTAKAVLGLIASGTSAAEIAAVGVDFGTAYRGDGWGSGLTVLTAMVGVLEALEPEDRPLALVHGMAFVSRDTRGRSPRFALAPLSVGTQGLDQLGSWYRRFVETRSASAAERVLVTAIATGASVEALSRMMLAATTDHVFLDGGHTIDFTNKAFEILDHVGQDAAGKTLPTIVAQTASATREEETGQWRHPYDLAGMVAECSQRIPSLLVAGQPRWGSLTDAHVAELAWSLLGDEPSEVARAMCEGISTGLTPEQIGRSVAYAASLRILRFHTQNDHGDWDVVHHGFTAANALHQLLVRSWSPELLRGAFHGAFKVFLDRFLNVPAARLPSSSSGSLDELQACWDEQGRVDDAGSIAYGYLRGGGDPAALVAALGHALLSEDAEFHWFQTYEAAVRQSRAWPRGSEEAALILTAAARFLAAHTPTRRELPQVVTIATRLRRGEELFEET